MLDREKAKALLGKALKLSPARMTEASLHQRDAAVTRFANNEIIQNVAENDLQVSIRVLHDDKMARVVTNKTDDDALLKCCERALQLAKNAAPDPDAIPLPGLQQYSEVDSAHAATTAFTAAARAKVISRAVEMAGEQKVSLAGIAAREGNVTAIRNSQGLFAYDNSTAATFSVTAAQDERTGAAAVNELDLRRIDFDEVLASAVEKVLHFTQTETVPRGEYTVILEPLAVLNLLSLLLVDYISQISHFSGSAVANKQGFVADRLGERVFGEQFTLDDNVFHPQHLGVPFDAEGMPKVPVILVYGGILTQLVHSRASALQMAAEPTGHGLELPNAYGAVPQHLVMHGGRESIDDMVRKTEYGLYITRFWYNRLVDPYALKVTGMTRDGTFLIRDGQIVAPVRNLRYNESLLGVFSRILDLGEERRTYDDESGQIMVVPPVRIEGFRFTDAG